MTNANQFTITLPDGRSIDALTVPRYGVGDEPPSSQMQLIAQLAGKEGLLFLDGGGEPPISPHNRS